MVKINNEEFRLYDLDSEQTLYERIASTMNTLPKFLIFTTGIPSIEDFSIEQNIVVLDLLDVIKKGDDIASVYKKIKEYQNNTIGTFSISEIIDNYTLLNLKFTNQYIQSDNLPQFEFSLIRDYYTTILKNEITKILDENNITDFIINQDTLNYQWNNKHNREVQFDKIIENNKQLTINTQNRLSQFDDIQKVECTSFNLEKITFDFELNVDNTSSILEIFNTIVLNKNIPFAATNNFYKILKEFKPPIEWVNLFDRSTSFRDKSNDINRETNIILKILEDKKIKNKERYIDIIISMKDINTIKISSEYNKNFISKDKIINSCLDILKTKNDPKNIKEVNVNGVYYMFENINKDVMLDMILNNNIFSKLLSVNEMSISTLASVHIYFENSILGKITLNLTPMKVSTKNIKSLLSSNIDENKIPLNTNMIRIRIKKCDNINKIKDFQNLFSKLIKLYTNEKPSIMEIYKNYGCSLETGDLEDENVKVKVDKKDEKDLQKIDPFVFDKKTKYTTNCSPDRKPRYLPDEEAKIKIEEGKIENIIKFPKEEIVDKTYPRYYICDREPYMYPGLQVNKYKETNELVPYLPCCFLEKQTDKLEYKDYYFTNDIDKTTTSMGSRNIKTSTYIIENFKKPLDRKMFGVLPPNLKKIFLIGDRNNIYYREGMLDTKSSFLNCVMQALDTKKLSNENEFNILPFLEKKRQDLATNTFAGYCAQEMFDYSINEIINKIKNIDEYLDPKLFIHLLELYFDCNIFLFSLQNDGGFIVPNNIQCHYKLKNEKKCIFIIENSALKDSYPRCELIVRYNTSKQIHKSIFDSADDISKLIVDTFDSYIKAYALNTKVSPVNINLQLEKLNITSQIFDAYGKTRILNIIYKSKNISLFTSPIQPLKLDSKFELTDPINKTNIKIAREILDILNATPIQEIKELNNTKIVGKINNVILHILIEDEKVANIYDSAMLNYNKYKKITRYIIEYMYWLFSTFLNETNTEANYIFAKYENIFYDFKNKYIEMDKDFKYEDIKKSFNLENSGIIKNKKLIVKSEDSLKRLFYILRLKLHRNLNEILNYKDKTMIENYYLDITDFSFELSQSIFQGEKVFFRLLNETTRNIIYKKINIIKEDEEYTEYEDKIEDEEEGKEKIINENLENSYFYVTKPYFFKNNTIDSKNIYIAQNIDSYLKGIKISMIWNRDKYNPGINVKINNEDNLNQNFTLYSYTNSNDIQIYNVEGNSNDLNIKIIGYKVDNPDKRLINFYTVLLPL